MRDKRIVTAAIAAATLACFAITGSAVAATYKIASSLAITGPTSDAGAPYAKGMEDFTKYVNDNKLLGDDTLEIIVRDDQYKTDVTKRNFEDFLDEGMLIFLSYSTGSNLALKSDIEEEQIPTLPASLHAGIMTDSNYILLPIGSYSAQVIGLAEFVAKNAKGSKPKVAMFIHPSAFGRGPVEDLEKAVEAGLGIDIVEVVEHGKDLDNTATIKRLQSKGVQYVITHTVQTPVATLLKGAEGLGVAAKTFGEEGKITFMGAHYTGGNDLIDLAGSAAENFFWTTGYTLTSIPGEGTDFQLKMAETYKRDAKTANSHNYTAGIMVVQIAAEAIKRAKAAGDVTNVTIYEQLMAMNGDKAFDAKTTTGPINFGKGDQEGVDKLQLYRANKGVFEAEGEAFIPEYVGKIK